MSNILCYPCNLHSSITCKTKQHFPYTTVQAAHERKQFHENENNSHESEMVPTTNAILTQREVGC